MGLSYASWGYANAWKADSRVQRLVQQCEQARRKLKYPTYSEWESAIQLDSQFQKSSEPDQSEILERGQNMYLCNPADLAYKYKLKGVQQQIDNTQQEATNDRSDGRLVGSVLFLLFCLPLLWYLLLDRIREVSGAVSGRDRNP